jgi:hypothetical protein
MIMPHAKDTRFLRSYHAEHREENPLLQIHMPVYDSCPPHSSPTSQQDCHVSALIQVRPGVMNNETSALVHWYYQQCMRNNKHKS